MRASGNTPASSTRIELAALPVLSLSVRPYKTPAGGSFAAGGRRQVRGCVRDPRPCLGCGSRHSFRLFGSDGSKSLATQKQPSAPSQLRSMSWRLLRIKVAPSTAPDDGYGPALSLPWHFDLADVNHRALPVSGREDARAKDDPDVSKRNTNWPRSSTLPRFCSRFRLSSAGLTAAS